MLETMAFAVPAVLALLALDGLLRSRTRRGAAVAAGERLLQAARVLGLFLLAGTLATSCRVAGDLAGSLLWMGAFGLAGLAALEVAEALGQRALRGLVPAVRDGNLAAATTAAAHTAAIGILVANVFGGTSLAELVIAAVSFGVGQLTLLLLVWLFRWLTSYDDRACILGGNLAAALSHGGLTIALALVIAHATDGEFVGTWPALRDYGVALAEGLLVYPLRQLVVQCLILRAKPTLLGGELDRAIGERGDVGVGALEATTYLAIALFVRSLA